MSWNKSSNYNNMYGATIKKNYPFTWFLKLVGVENKFQTLPTEGKVCEDYCSCQKHHAASDLISFVRWQRLTVKYKAKSRCPPPTHPAGKEECYYCNSGFLSQATSIWWRTWYLYETLCLCGISPAPRMPWVNCFATSHSRQGQLPFFSVRVRELSSADLIYGDLGRHVITSTWKPWRGEWRKMES
jgi:hypothetical protein